VLRLHSPKVLAENPRYNNHCQNGEYSSENGAGNSTELKLLFRYNAKYTVHCFKRSRTGLDNTHTHTYTHTHTHTHTHRHTHARTHTQAYSYLRGGAQAGGIKPKSHVQMPVPLTPVSHCKWYTFAHGSFYRLPAITFKNQRVKYKSSNDKRTRTISAFS